MKALILITVASFVIAVGTLWFGFAGRDGPDLETLLITERSQLINALKKRAEEGDAKAHWELGKRYTSGDGLFIDNGLAFTHFKAAAEKSHVRAQVETGWALENAIGVKRSYTRAAAWYRVAAKAGRDAEAQFLLGLMHFRGRGVEHNYQESLNLFRKSANRGHAGAQYFLGAMYQDGWGVSINHVTAYAYYSLAAEAKAVPRGSELKIEPEKNLEKLAVKMTKAQIDEGKKLAKKLAKKLR
jgi:TPR repeat protein